MKFLAPAAIAVLASSVAAAPVAAPEADFLGALLNIGLGIDLFGLDVGADVSAQAGIYITPDNRLTYGSTVPGSVSFTGAVVNGDLYVKSPWLNNDGCVNINAEGEISLAASVGAQLGWYPSGGYIYPNGKNIYACPDGHGNDYIYVGGNCANGRQIHFKSQ